jgi:RNA polymerase sigma-70 factor (ECF subfamily)
MTLAQPREGPAHPEDLRLMQLVAHGDPRARSMVAMRLCTRVRRIERALLTDLADADDATQDSLVAIIRSAEGYRGDSPLERWADRIAVRTGLRFRRRARVRSTEPQAEVATPAGNDELAERLPRPLAAYLRELPVRERQALFLKHALGYSVPEIAELTDTARSTVKFWLANAMKRVRKSIRRDVAIGPRGGAR